MGSFKWIAGFLGWVSLGPIGALLGFLAVKAMMDGKGWGFVELHTEAGRLDDVHDPDFLLIQGTDLRGLRM